MKRIYIYITLLAFTCITCKKQTLQPGNSPGQPVFYFNGNVNSVPVSLKAGINNYYMYSSYTQDSVDVYNFTGSLHQVSCTNCPNSIEFIINDYKITSPGGPATIDSSLAIGYYNYKNLYGGTSSSYSINFSSLPDGYKSVLAYNWNFGDGGNSTVANPTHKFLHPGKYYTTLTVQYSGGCNAVAADTVGNGTPTTQIHSSITSTVIDTITPYDSISFSATVSGGTPPYTYLWDFGDGQTSSAVSPTHNFMSTGQYNVTLKTTDAGSSANYTNTTISNRDTNCFVNFTSGTVISDTNLYALSNVTVVYTDGSGDVYSSANVATQPATTFFQVTSVSGYQNNENNQTTKMLHIKFTCQLKDGSGNIMNITNGDAIIAVAYK